jgi:pimeloyl-ACP methyl ester carboxylesterase
MEARQLFSEARGDGQPALVFLHGLAASGRYWYQVADALAGGGRQLHLVDLLGFGRSPWPDLAYTVDDHLAALSEWRAAAGLAGTPLILVGHSLGALVSLAWAGRTPRVIGAVLVALPVYHDPAEARRRLACLSLLHRLTLGIPPLAHATCAVMCRYRPLWRLLAPLIVRRVPPTVARDGVLHSWRSLSGTLEHCIFGTAPERVREQAARTPLLFVHGDADDTAPIAAVRELAARLPNAELFVVPGCGHDVPLFRPTVVADATARFAGGAQRATRRR